MRTRLLSVTGIFSKKNSFLSVRNPSAKHQLHGAAFNKTRFEQFERLLEYVVVGGGPAAICAIPNILAMQVSPQQILWLDPEFRVGDFGTTLSKGSSVPGNTTVASYLTVLKEIHKTVPGWLAYQPSFKIDEMAGSYVCSLKIASEPLQVISNNLRQNILSIKGKVSDITTCREGLNLEVQDDDMNKISINSKRVILATGAQARTVDLSFASNSITMIDPNICFIQTELQQYINENPDIQSVAVIGSSHSAALAVMHLLKAGLRVKQFMSHEYKFASPAISAEGVSYTLFDNTGLKGDVAAFTRKLLREYEVGVSQYQDKFIRFVGRNKREVNSLLQGNISDCTHAVTAIGYEAAPTLRVNNCSLRHYEHSSQTSEFKLIPGLFGIGIGFPQQVKALSGEIEYAVGVGKFWNTAKSSLILDTWKNNIAGSGDGLVTSKR